MSDKTTKRIYIGKLYPSRYNFELLDEGSDEDSKIIGLKFVLAGSSYSPYKENLEKVMEEYYSNDALNGEVTFRAGGVEDEEKYVEVLYNGLPLGRIPKTPGRKDSIKQLKKDFISGEIGLRGKILEIDEDFWIVENDEEQGKFLNCLIECIPYSLEEDREVEVVYLGGNEFRDIIGKRIKDLMQEEYSEREISEEIEEEETQDIYEQIESLSMDDFALMCLYYVGAK
jgi:hypothetical protein